MENESKYKLKAKYDGISLEFGSQVMVYNATITDELGAKLLKKRGEQIFELFPKNTIIPKEPKKNK